MKAYGLAAPAPVRELMGLRPGAAKPAMVWAILAAWLIGGCGRPWQYQGSAIQKTLTTIEDEEIIELTYSWRELLTGVPRQYRHASGGSGDKLVRWLADADAHVPTYHVCVDISEPVMVGQLTELHRELVTVGFYTLVGAPGQPWKRTWTYRAPPGVRQRAEELLPRLLDQLRDQLCNDLPDVAICDGPVVMREHVRAIFVWSVRITPSNTRRWRELVEPLPESPDATQPPPGKGREFPVLSPRVWHIFPTLGRVVGLEATIPQEDEPQRIRRAMDKALAPLTELDPRHHVWPDDGPLPAEP